MAVKCYTINYTLQWNPFIFQRKVIFLLKSQPFTNCKGYMNLFINSLVSQHTWAIMQFVSKSLKKRRNRVLTELEMKSQSRKSLLIKHVQCINRTPVYPEHKSWSEQSTIWAGFTVLFVEICSNSLKLNIIKIDLCKRGTLDVISKHCLLNKIQKNRS